MPRLTEVCHDTRLEILNLLQLNSKSLTDLSKIINLSKPEISRHLSRLHDQGLITKEERSYEITDLGNLIVKILSLFEVILDHYEFFQTHSVIDLPMHVIRDLDMLSSSELIEGTGYIFAKIEEVSQKPTTEIKIIANEPFPDYRTQIVSTAYFILPSRVKSFFKEKLSNEFANKYTTYAIRTLPVINYPLGIIDDKYGFLFFSDLNGKVDYNYAFYTEDLTCIKFISNIWDHFWASLVRLCQNKRT